MDVNEELKFLREKNSGGGGRAVRCGGRVGGGVGWM